MKVFVFKKIGFKDRQSEKLKDANNRKAILIDVNINNDMKVLCLHQQKDYTLLPTYLEIIFNLDLETESWEVREDSLVSWCKRTFGVNNRFNVEQRLEFLQSQGLISFEVIGNNTQTIAEVSVNNTQTYQEVLPNLSETIAEVTPLETPKTLVALRALKTNKTNKDKQTNKGDFSEGFLNFWDEYPSSRRVDQTGCWKKWESRDLESMSETIHASVVAYKQTESWNKNEFQFVPITSTFINQSRWETPVPATGDKPQPVKGKPSWPSQDDPDYDRKVAEYMAGITVGFADAKAERYGN